MGYKIKPLTTFLDEILPVPFWEIYQKPPKEAPYNVIYVTELIDTPLRRKLLRQFPEQIEKNFKLIHNQILGTLVHYFLEIKEWEVIKDDLEDAILKEDKDKVFEIVQKFFYQKKKSFSVELMGWKIVGTIDYFDEDEKIIYDFKLTTSLAFNFIEEKLSKYEEQLQIYRYLMEKNGIQIAGLRNLFILKDYSILSETLASPLYLVEYDLWSLEETENFIIERLKLHQDEEFHFCPPEDIWFRTQYKVGNRTFSVKEKALNYIQKFGGKLETVSLGPIRCLYYCEVSSICPQFEAYKNLMEKK